MAFTLTKEHVRELMDSINEGSWDSFLATVDRNVKWIVGDPLHDPKSLTGTYVSWQYPTTNQHCLITVQNLQSYVQKVVTPLFSRLESSTKMTIEELDVIGQKAFVETSGVATQKNGKPYNNK
jgi:hypothetical protein